MEPTDGSTERLVLADRYRLDRRIGAGALSEVWEATDLRLQRTVAVKVLEHDPASWAEDPATVRRRFANEGRAIAQVVHPSIVEVYDAGEDGDVAYLVLERLPGETLRSRMASGRMDPNEVRQAATAVLAALGAAHAAGIVHRDVKPSNVLADGHGGWKLVDFGIAKPIGADPASDLTTTGLLVGTHRYLAPEVLAGGSPSVASDLYATGVLLGDLLGAATVADPALVAVAGRATTADPTQRYDSAAAMAAAIAATGSGAGDGETALLAPIDLPTAVLAGGHRDAGDLADAPTDAQPWHPSAVAPVPAATGRTRQVGRWAVLAAMVLLVVAAAALATTTAGDDAPGVRRGSSSTTLATTSVPPTTNDPTTTTTTTTTEPAADDEPPKDKGKDEGKDKGRGDGGDDEGPGGDG